jgi:molecular chaperone GrpE
MHDIPDVAAKPDGRPDDGSESATAADAAEATPTSVEEQLRKAESAARGHQEAWLRARAEADNIRKRAQTEIASAHKFALENFAGELLPVKDSLEAALSAENATTDSIVSGVLLTLKQLTTVFDRFNITEVNPLGQKFDPHRHQAISTQESDAEPNTVLQVLQKGYQLHDRVVRPALVIVAKAVEK